MCILLENGNSGNVKNGVILDNYPNTIFRHQKIDVPTQCIFKKRPD